MKFTALVSLILSVLVFVPSSFAIDSEPILKGNPAAIDSEPILFPLDIDLDSTVKARPDKGEMTEIKVTYSTNEGRFIKVTYRSVESKVLSYAEVKKLGLLK